MTEKLKPCPFCGGPASLGYFGDYEITASCDGPGDCPGRAGASVHFSDDEDAKRLQVCVAWNTRAVPQEVVELVKAAREFRQAFVIATGGKSPFCKVALDILDAALTPFKEIGND